MEAELLERLETRVQAAVSVVQLKLDEALKQRASDKMGIATAATYHPQSARPRAHTSAPWAPCVASDGSRRPPPLASPCIAGHAAEIAKATALRLKQHDAFEAEIDAVRRQSENRKAEAEKLKAESDRLKAECERIEALRLEERAEAARAAEAARCEAALAAHRADEAEAALATANEGLAAAREASEQAEARIAAAEAAIVEATAKATAEAEARIEDARREAEEATGALRGQLEEREASLAAAYAAAEAKRAQAAAALAEAEEAGKAASSEAIAALQAEADGKVEAAQREMRMRHLSMSLSHAVRERKSARSAAADLTDARERLQESDMAGHDRGARHPAARPAAEAADATTQTGPSGGPSRDGVGGYDGVGSRVGGPQQQQQQQQHFPPGVAEGMASTGLPLAEGAAGKAIHSARTDGGEAASPLDAIDGRISDAAARVERQMRARAVAVQSSIEDEAMGLARQMAAEIAHVMAMEMARGMPAEMAASIGADLINDRAASDVVAQYPVARRGADNEYEGWERPMHAARREVREATVKEAAACVTTTADTAAAEADTDADADIDAAEASPWPDAAAEASPWSDEEEGGLGRQRSYVYDNPSGEPFGAHRAARVRHEIPEHWTPPPPSRASTRPPSRAGMPTQQPVVSRPSRASMAAVYGARPSATSVPEPVLRLRTPSRVVLPQYPVPAPITPRPAWHQQQLAAYLEAASGLIGRGLEAVGGAPSVLHQRSPRVRSAAAAEQPSARAAPPPGCAGRGTGEAAWDRQRAGGRRHR